MEDATHSLFNEFQTDIVWGKRKTYKNLCGQMVDQTGMDVGFLDQKKCSETREYWESSRDCEQSYTSSRV